SRDYERAEFFFKEANELGPKLFPDSRYYYAQCLKRNAQYNRAIDEFQYIRARYKGPSRDKIRAWSRKEIEACDYALDEKRKKPKFIIEHLNKNINSYYSDFAPVIINNNTLLYSSLKTDTIISYNDENRFTKLFFSKKINNQWSPSTLFEEFEIENEGHIANGSYSIDKKRFYFSFCKYKGLANAKCKIYVSSYLGDMENWTEPEELNKSINLPKTNNTQPSIGRYKDGNEVLYFASDREGSVGGRDIWHCVISENEKYEEVKNCGKRINTDRDEFSPYYDNKSNSLYFSSDGHPGFGGLDVFNATGIGKRWQRPVNLGYILNSSLDDVYFTINEKGDHGFFASNRKGGLSLRHPTCCDDIYAFKYLNIIELKLNGEIIVNNDTAPDIKNKIQLSYYFSDSIGQNQILIEQKNLKGRTFDFDIKENKCYTLKAFAEQDSFGFKGEKTFCTYGITKSGTIEKVIKLELFEKSKNYEIDEIEYNKPYPLINDISFNKFKLNKKSKEGLYDLLLFLKENNKLIITILSHTDNLGTETYNLKLSKKRAESVVKYLVSKGISKKRLSSEGKGESEPIAPNTMEDGSDNPDGRMRNRRTEFMVTDRLP
ncbi:MAG TPA: hypothetical protein EYQ86_01075, partial [Bacteroidetes bacterium]|nr:hypothetical protein [Bacteroidota bacterium]